MHKLPLTEDFFATPDGEGKYLHGRVYHQALNEHGGGVLTPIARYFVWPADIGPEGFHPHSRVDCFVRDHELAPPEDWLARRLADALLRHGVIEEPVWVSWHLARETGGEARGGVCDFD